MARTGIFISHAHDDQELAQSVRRFLEAALGLTAADITCTSDADYGLEHGDDLMEQIRRRLKSARALFLIATPVAHLKDWVNFECGFAERERDAGQMELYVLTPTSGHREAVPLPYQGRISVTLSDGRDLHALTKQLQKAFGLTESRVSGDYLDALLNLEHRCAALELDAARTERAGELRKTEIRRQKLAADAKWRLPLAFAAGVVLAAAVGWWQVTSTTSRLTAYYTEKQDQLKTEFSHQSLEAYNVMVEELKRLPFAGLIHDGFMHPLECTTVEALVPDDNGGERTVRETCENGGTFTFSGPALRSDPRQPITLKVRVGKAGQELHTVPLKRADSRLAINVLRMTR